MVWNRFHSQSANYHHYRVTQRVLGTKREPIQTVGNGVLSQIFASSIDVRRQHLFHHVTTALIRLIRSEAQDAEILQRKTKWHQPLVQLLNESHAHLRTLILNNIRHYWCCCLSAIVHYKQWNHFPSTVKFRNALRHSYLSSGYHHTEQYDKRACMMLSDKCDIRYKMFGINCSQKNESQKHLFHHRHTYTRVLCNKTVQAIINVHA